ncbi:MAG: peptide chain release factor-like protein [Dehalococcoidia bacterium]|nr:peptide chain release factor-like protein [Dehalococcoidia bacterium]
MADWRDYLGLSDAELFEQCEFDRFRASGPGGQKKNKTASAVRLRHRPTGLTGEAVEERSQHLNRARALRRLRMEIAYGLRAPVDVEAGPPEVSFGLPSARNPAYPPAVAHLFDVLEACGWRLAEAAPHLGITTARLGRALAREEALFRAVSERRQGLGLPALNAER